MRKIGILFFKSLRKILGSKELNRPVVEDDIDVVSQTIFNALIADKPYMIARFGAFELATLVNYIGVKKGINVKDFLIRSQKEWWWDKKLMKAMQLNAGFFPPTPEKLTEFSELLLSDINDLDILGSWLGNENYIEGKLNHCIKLARGKIDPFWSDVPWTNALANKKVLVIHPFSKSIEKQYKNKDLLFENKLLPSFDLLVYRPVVSFADNNVDFKDWFEALEYMKEDISKIDFDICLIGAGAYGFHLAAHIKRMGRKSVHMGGSLQLLFGIRGNRWENEKVLGKINYQKLPNEYWIRALVEEQPKSKNKVENGAYW